MEHWEKRKGRRQRAGRRGGLDVGGGVRNEPALLPPRSPGGQWEGAEALAGHLDGRGEGGPGPWRAGSHGVVGQEGARDVSVTQSDSITPILEKRRLSSRTGERLPGPRSQEPGPWRGLGPASSCSAPGPSRGPERSPQRLPGTRRERSGWLQGDRDEGQRTDPKVPAGSQPLGAPVRVYTAGLGVRTSRRAFGEAETAGGTAKVAGPWGLAVHTPTTPQR